MRPIVARSLAVALAVGGAGTALALPTIVLDQDAVSPDRFARSLGAFAPAAEDTIIRFAAAPKPERRATPKPNASRPAPTPHRVARHVVAQPVVAVAAAPTVQAPKPVRPAKPTAISAPAPVAAPAATPVPTPIVASPASEPGAAQAAVRSIAAVSTQAAEVVEAPAQEAKTKHKHRRKDKKAKPWKPEQSPALPQPAVSDAPTLPNEEAESRDEAEGELRQDQNGDRSDDDGDHGPERDDHGHHNDGDDSGHGQGGGDKDAHGKK
jgi:hypothetical protein